MRRLTVTFHTGTLERLVGEPETVLADEEERVIVPGVAEDR